MMECEDGLWLCNYEFDGSDGTIRMVYGCVITNLMVPMGLSGWFMVV
jgi:hypothetical protein